MVVYGKGTTIGYGDVSPKTDAGKLAVALYAIAAVNVVASLLEPAKEFLLSFCFEQPQVATEKQDKDHKAKTARTKANVDRSIEKKKDD